MKFFLFILITNFLLYSIAAYLSLDRVVMNIDYAICLIMVFFGFRKFTVFLFALTFIADLLLLSRQIFPFFRIEDILYIIKFTFISSTEYKFLFLFIFIYIVVACYFILKAKPKQSIYIHTVFILALLFVFQTLYNSILNQQKNWITSQVVIFTALQNEGFAQNLRMKQGLMQSMPYSKASAKLYTTLNNGEKKNHNVLFIVNESLGMPKDSIVLKQLLSPLYATKSISDIEVNQTPYVGPTVFGELRELCHAQPSNFNLKSLKVGFDECLPQLFKRIGYETTSIHGALGVMYDRKYWYPRAGFQKMIFFESHVWRNYCYSFPGACDWELGPFITNLFVDAKKPQFIYWLTLNSHAVYDKRDIHFNIFDCSQFNIEEKTESCRNLKLQAQFFYVLAEMINSQKMKGTEVVIVGDHSPIIFDAAEKQKYFDQDNILILNFNVN